MSWGYWGIVTVLVIQVAMFFVCMYIVNSNAKDKGQRQTPDRPTSEAVEASKRAPAINRKAA